MEETIKGLIKELIKKRKEYIEVTILTKRGMKNRIVDLERDLKAARKNEEYAINQMNKYKTKNTILNKQIKKLEIDYKLMSEDFKKATKTIEKLEKKYGAK